MKPLLGTDPDSNPLAQGVSRSTVPAPCTVVIFGATGDLTARKLVPALYSLFLDGLIDPSTAVVGVERRPVSDEEFRTRMHTAVEQHSRQKGSAEDWERFASGLHYHQAEFGDLSGYHSLAETLTVVDRERNTGGHHIFYLATPPRTYPEILAHLGEAGLAQPPQDGFSRVIVEKPFGRDLDTAQELNESVARSFQEDQVYRIDHYLGKETVQNILVFRLGNGIFEPLWNRRYVDHVQITVAESLGVGTRAGYYDKAGVLRDMFQNHLMQLLTLVAMEPPVRFQADAVRDEKVKVLRALKLPDPGVSGPALVRARYAAGDVGGAPVPGYLEEKGVSAESDTETFLATRLEVDNWRWAGVPFFLRSGKRLPRRVTEIALVFRKPPQLFFDDRGNRASGAGAAKPNVLALRIQPDEGISLSFGSKMPGQEMHLENVRMDFLYATSFGGDPPEAYEHLLLDAIEGDSTLFARRDEVELAWALTDEIRARWEAPDGAPLSEYEAGTWGPIEARALLGEGRGWRRI